MIDVNAFLGASPWRPVPGIEPAALLVTMDQLGIGTAWVTHLPSLYWKDPAESHAELFGVAGRYPRLRPVPVIHPGVPDWEADLRRAAPRFPPAHRPKTRRSDAPTSAHTGHRA